MVKHRPYWSNLPGQGFRAGVDDLNFGALNRSARVSSTKPLMALVAPPACTSDSRQSAEQNTAASSNL
jgi:hypothetical protein